MRLGDRRLDRAPGQLGASEAALPASSMRPILDGAVHRGAGRRCPVPCVRRRRC